METSSSLMGEKQKPGMMFGQVNAVRAVDIGPKCDSEGGGDEVNAKHPD